MIPASSVILAPQDGKYTSLETFSEYCRALMYCVGR